MASSHLIRKAINSAEKHGISLTPGRQNPAIGDCAFEAVIFNINDRDCFNEKLNMSVAYYRRIWAIDMKNNRKAAEKWKDLSDKEWEEGWTKMMNPGEYMLDYFADMMLPGISCGSKKNILIFNTNPDLFMDPIGVVKSADFGVAPDSPNPVILAYNGSHYESLHTKTAADI